MGHPPGAVSLPHPAYAGLAPAVERIAASWGATPAELAALLRDDGPPGPDQLAAIAWVLTADRTRLLLVDHRTYGWSCPGGHVERGESPAAAAAHELAEETGLRLASIDADPVTLTLVEAPADAVGPPHRHWLLGYRFVADPGAPLVPERDPLAWHRAAALPRDVVADIPPLWEPSASFQPGDDRPTWHDACVRQRSALLAAISVLAAIVAAGCNDSSPADAEPAPIASPITTAAAAAATISAPAAPTTAGGERVAEFPIEYPPDRMAHGSGAGSTHELTADPAGDAFWITGQNESTIVKAALDGSMQTFEMPDGSGPHGIVFDGAGRLWVSLEFAGEVVRLDAAGTIVQTIDVKIECATCAAPLNPHPHGLAVGTDGATLWYTGKATGTIGRIASDGTVTTFPLKTVGAVPIYIEAASDGSMWFTELVGNSVGRVTPDGKVDEFPIPTWNSRPISLVRDPEGGAMWFSEEAGNKVARVTLDGTITEFAVPMAQANNILAALSFDSEGDLWVQQYVDPHRPDPPGDDHVVEIDRDIRTADPGNVDNVTFTYHTTPSTDTVMHRIVLGPDGALWFTELATNRLGRIAPT